MKELEPSIQVFRTRASRGGQCLLSKLETSCQASSMKLRTAVAIAKLKASSPLFLLEKDETERFNYDGKSILSKLRSSSDWRY